MLVQEYKTINIIGFLPRYFTTRAIQLYIILVVTLSIFFNNQPLPVIWMFSGLVAVVAFFLFTTKFSKKWSLISNKAFERKLIFTALIVRIVYVIASYLFYDYMNGDPFEFLAADSKGYYGEAEWVGIALEQGDLSQYLAYIGSNYSDMGYPFYLGILNYLIGDSILIPRLLKAVYGTFSCLFVYRLASRNFGNTTGRLAGIMVMVMPSLIYYCGIHTKETEMVFVLTAFIERADFVLRTKNIKFLDLILVGVLGVLLFFFRTVLGAAAFFSFFVAVVSTSRSVVPTKRKILIMIAGGVFGAYLLSGAIGKNVGMYLEASDTNQVIGLANKANRVGGNEYAKYGGAVIFAPIILVAPFPTLINIETQQNQMLLNGGYFVKNILAYFVILALILLYKRKLLWAHSFIISFVLSYLAILALSTFALSERFHLPALPFITILGAYGISHVDQKNKKFYIPYLLFLLMIIIGWNWFKIAGRA